MSRHTGRVALLLLGWLSTAGSVRAVDPVPPTDEFFEKKIRPVLVAQCYKCHSDEAQTKNKLKANLRLDSHEAIRAGGDSGPVLVPKKASDSLLLKSLRYDGDLKMPPAGKLPDAVIQDFETWIGRGAPGLPRATSLTRRPQQGLSIEAGRSFWAYQPVRTGPVPKVLNPEWDRNPIDAFILAKLETKGFRPAPVADRVTLVRRLYFDLHGLPPTPDQVRQFVEDRDPAAYEKLVDHLLASPQFGERWGRHWLDIARYAESVTLRGFIFKNAWRYRDYVIDSINQDVPFDQFIRQQLAGDLLPAATPEERTRNLIATTFLMLGNTNLEEQDKKQLRMDVVDEQLDVLSKGFLAQTVTCARCHDHKFDPIPTADYYALAGIFRNVKALETANVSMWLELPLPLPADEEAKLKTHEAAVLALQAKIKSMKGPTGVAKGVVTVATISGVVVDDVAAKKVGEWQHSTHSGNYIGAGYLHDQNMGKGDKTLTFQPETLPAGRYEVRLAYSQGTSRSTAVPVEVFSADGDKVVSVDMTKAPPIEGRYVSLGEYRFEKSGQNHVIISNEGTKGHVTADAVVYVPLDGADRTTTSAKTGLLTPATNGDPVKKLEADLKKLQASGPRRPLTMGVVEEPTIEETRVHVRGSVHNLGALTPRGVLQVATVGPRPSFPKGQSGRKELADWIAAADNPLTSRVFVNRTWHWLFGSGLVRTPDNFGTTGELPSHPALLDHLAQSFTQSGWSVKKLVRQMVLSRTYQQSVRGDDRLVAADPENRLFGRANRRRLDAECIRDAMLVVSGALDTTPRGPTFPETLASDYGFQIESNRRSVYLPQFRNALPEALEVFDAADPSTVTGRRNTSTVPQQALYLMNHPFPQAQARRAAERLSIDPGQTPEQTIQQTYRLVLGRDPTTGEQTLAMKYVTQHPDPKRVWADLIQMLFATPDFRFVD